MGDPPCLRYSGGTARLFVCIDVDASVWQREEDVTELIWDGKYTADGKRVAPLRVALPFQTVETVNESAQQRQFALDFFARYRRFILDLYQADPLQGYAWLHGLQSLVPDKDNPCSASPDATLLSRGGAAAPEV